MNTLQTGQTGLCRIPYARLRHRAGKVRSKPRRAQTRKGCVTTAIAPRVDAKPLKAVLKSGRRDSDKTVVVSATTKQQSRASTRLATQVNTYLPPVNKLAEILNTNGEFYDQFQEAIDRARAYDVHIVNKTMRVPEDYLNYADFLLRTPPFQDGNSRNVYQALSLFYFILDQEPLKSLQSPIVPSNQKQVLTPLSEFIVEYGKAWGNFMNTPESAAHIETFRDDAYFNWNDYVIPPEGFKTFNEYFARHVKPHLRPIAGKEDDRLVVCPADACLVGHWNIDSDSTIFSQGLLQVKGIEWTIRQLLDDSKYSQEFAGGTFTHSFLNTFNYHRYHSPVRGKVVEVKNIPGQCYLDVSVIPNQDGKGNVVKVLNAADGTGYQFVQTRGLVVIDSPIGLVACLPIGMAQVSSVNFTVKEGDVIEKGQELGYFLFGGSDFVTVFQNRAEITVLGYRNVQALQGQALAYAHGKVTECC